MAPLELLQFLREPLLEVTEAWLRSLLQTGPRLPNMGPHRPFIQINIVLAAVRGSGSRCRVASGARVGLRRRCQSLDWPPLRVVAVHTETLNADSRSSLRHFPSLARRPACAGH